jgi:hypothetical protein
VYTLDDRLQHIRAFVAADTSSPLIPAIFPDMEIFIGFP